MRHVRFLMLLAALLSGGLAGCAINPFIAPTRVELSKGANASEKVRIAVDYADRVYDAYATMPSKEFDRQQALSTGLFVVGAATLGMAAGSVHRDGLIGAALIGGTAYEIGTWNSNSVRQAIFVEGRKSLACGRAAISPLDLSEDELQRIRGRVDATVKAAKDGSKAAGDVTRWLSVVSSQEDSPSALVTASQAELAAFGQRYDAANQAIVHAGGAERLVSAAGGLLVAHVDNVRTLVDSALNDTLSALTALPKAIGDLGKSAAIFAPGLDLGSTLTKKVTAQKGAAGTGSISEAATAEDGEIDPKTGKPVQRVENELRPADLLSKALGRLRQHSGSLEVETNALRAVDPMALEKLQTAIAACNPDLAKAMRPLAVTPTTINIEAGTAAAAAVSISGGTTPYTVAVLNTPMKGINSQIQADAILLTAGADTVADSVYPIRISDSTGANVMVTIKVVAKPAAAPTTGTDPKADQAKKDKNAVGTNSPKKKTETAKALEACVAPEADKCEVAGAECSFECVSKKQMQGIRQRLGLSPTPEQFDKEVREKLLQLQKNKSLSPTGRYDADTARAVQNLSKS